jgi:glycosyltransferase involved in cell wall biosynthesis
MSLWNFKSFKNYKICIECGFMKNVTLLYNIITPTSGVGRHNYEVVNRLKKRIKFNEINLFSSFGNTNLTRLFSLIWKRKNYLYQQKDKLGEINHFLQTEIYYHVKGINVVTLHNSPPFKNAARLRNLIPDFNSLIRSILYVKRYEDAAENADILIANSQQTKNGCLEMGVDEKRVEVINYGVDKRFKIINGLDERENLIGFVGSFAFHKRVSKLLGDWKKNYRSFENKYSLKLYGSSGAFLKYLKNKYDNKYNVHFMGHLSYEHSLMTFNSFKALAFPSKFESFGLPIIEAVACGTPVFIYRDSEISDEVRKFAIEVGSMREIPEFLEKIKQRDLIKNSLKVKKDFDWDKNAEKTIKLYKRL